MSTYEKAQKAEQIANDLINAMINGRIRKDVLMNTAQDFTGNGEEKFIVNYRNYLRSVSYLMDKKALS
jgi:hypothetical protein